MRVSFAVGLLVVSLLLAAEHGLEAQTRVNVDRDGLGIEGYDPVAYFRLGAAIPGDQRITATHEGVRYRFSTQEHRRLFLDNPEQYLPAYGGWCAYAMAEGNFARIQPEQFVIHDGRLYLNFNRRINRRFQRDIEGYIASADSAWRELGDTM